MKQVYIIAVILFVGQRINCQVKDDVKLIGKWKLEKMVISSEVFFDISDKDSTRRNFLRQQKEKNYNSSWTFQDSSTVEKLYQRAMNDIERMFLELKSDSTYVTNALNRKKGEMEGTEGGTFSFNSDAMELTLYEDRTRTNINELKVLLLNDTTLVLVGKDRTSRSPILTYKRN